MSKSILYSLKFFFSTEYCGQNYCYPNYMQGDKEQSKEENSEFMLKESLKVLTSKILGDAVNINSYSRIEPHLCVECRLPCLAAELVS